MTKSLPTNPSLVFLRKEAKSIRKSLKQKDASVCPILRNLHRFKEKSDAEILESRISLQEVQFALALEYGFKDWNEMKAYVGENQSSSTMVESLNGVQYRLEWLTPARLADSGLDDVNNSELRTPDGEYAGHVHPLYNFHCELLSDEEQRDLGDKNWPEFWKELAEELPNQQPFALVAFQEDKLAGYIRFFPSDRSRLRVPPELHVKNKDVLLIGAACVDLQGKQDGLERELVQRVIQFASSKNYKSIQALGWSDLRNYSVWGESFPMPVYESLGFSKASEIKGSEDVLNHMIEGAHGEEDKQQMEEAIQDGKSRDTMNNFNIMQLDLKNQKVKRDGSKVWIEGVPNVLPGSWWDSSLRGLQSLLKQRGLSLDMDEILVFSGDAFHLPHCERWHERLHMCIPTDPLANVADICGFKNYTIADKFSDEIKPEAKQKKTMETLESIWSEIENGRPVLVGGSSKAGCTVWSVVTGYDREKLEMCHNGINPDGMLWDDICEVSVIMNKERGPRHAWNVQLRGTAENNGVGRWMDNPAFILGEKNKEFSPKQKCRTVLKNAVELFNAEITGFPDWQGFRFGRDAYEQLAESYQELSLLENLSNQQWPSDDGWYTLEEIAHQADLLIRGRKAASIFCKKQAAVIPEIEQELTEASEEYLKESKIAEEIFGDLLDNPIFKPSWFSDRKKRMSAAEFWLSKCDLKAVSKAILQMLEHEKTAIAEIEKALAVMEG